jgi:hypothetical protein
VSREQIVRDGEVTVVIMDGRKQVESIRVEVDRKERKPRRKRKHKEEYCDLVISYEEYGARVHVNIPPLLSRYYRSISGAF